MSAANGSVGKRVRERRHALGLSQRELAEPGVSYAYISRIEAGARQPSVKAMRKLSAKLGVSVRWLETGEDALEFSIPRELAEHAVALEREVREALDADDLDPQDASELMTEASRAKGDAVASAWHSIREAVESVRPIG